MMYVACHFLWFLLFDMTHVRVNVHASHCSWLLEAAAELLLTPN